ncbi:MAG: monothiol glutaredoxin grx4 [Lichina confinis]|nr:MAG: monothiol glutaredoxin grx4 [Lichina confinis]
MTSPQDIETEADFNRHLDGAEAAGDAITILNFYATWAAPCEQMRNILSTLASSYRASHAPALSFLSIDAEKLFDVAERYDVSSVPLLVVLKGAKTVETVSGSDASKIRDAVERHAGKPGATTTTTKEAQLPPLQRVEHPPQGSSNANGSSGHAPMSADGAAAPETTATAKDELNQRLAALVSAAPVMLFIKGTPSVPQCGFSRQLVGLLREHGVRYGFFNILADEEVRHGLKEFSDWPTFPQLYVGGELVGGLDIVKEEFSTDSDFLKAYADNDRKMATA